MPRPGVAKGEVTPCILGPAGSLESSKGGTICFAKTLELHLEGHLDPSPILMLQGYQGALKMRRGKDV